MATMVTGASGFLGRRLVQRLLSDGHDVIGVDIQKIPTLFAGKSGLKWIQRDLSCEMITTEEIIGVNTVFHLAGATLGAGLDEHSFCLANEITTIGLLKICAGKVNRIIHASSQVVYGNVDSVSISENFDLNGYDSAYACSKVNAENWLHWFRFKYGGMYIALRFCGFIEGGGIIDYMIGRALLDEPIELFSKGQICRDYLPVEKGIDALIAASSYVGMEDFHAFNIGSGQAVTAIEIASIVCEELGSSSEVVLLDRPAVRNNFVFDITKARSELGFESGSLSDAVKVYARSKVEGRV